MKKLLLFPFLAALAGLLLSDREAPAQATCPPGVEKVSCLPLASSPLNRVDGLWGLQNGKTVNIQIGNILDALGITPATSSLASNLFLATPSGGSGALAARAIATADLPNIPIAGGGTGATTAATARTNLGLGTAATFNASGVGPTLPTLNFAATGQCAEFSDNVGTLTATPCSGGGGGSGTVGSGVAGQVPFYASNGTVLTANVDVTVLTTSPGHVTFGLAGGPSGTLTLEGGASGAVTIQTQAAAGTYNFNLPTGAGTSGQALLSGGGGTAPQTYGILGIPAGGTAGTTATQALNNLTAAGLTLSNTYSGPNTYNGLFILGAAAQDKVRIITGAGAVTASATTDHLICINKSVGQATTVNLPATPTTGQEFVIKDCKGDANVNNITITPAAGTIEGAATLILSQARQAVVVTAVNEGSGAFDTWIAH